MPVRDLPAGCGDEAALPTGTVTFLFTDVEGSTRLWEQHPDAAHQALVQHDALIELLAEIHRGRVVRPRGEGDSRFCVFPRASDALAAAAAMQRALHEERWPTPTPLKVRMALHTGEADLRGGDYYGSAVNRCARLRSIAHGGQTLVSQATADLAREALPEELALRDLGEHRLKDLTRPERVWQLDQPGLAAQFPLLKSLDSVPNNLPVQATHLVAREDDVAAVRARLLAPDVRLLTLLGPGGTGKTRLSLQVAAESLEELPDGAFFVALAPLRDPAHVEAAIASALGVGEAPGRPMIESLVDYLRDKRLLLVLDNFEHVLPAAPSVGTLVARCPTLKVLATSREPLHLYGERTFPVPPLRLPDDRDRDDPAQYGAVRLFVERARDTLPEFALTPENSAAVVAICRRLDGLPLAIELAAARVRLLPPPALLARLERAAGAGGAALALLKGGARDLPTRQQTLRDAIAWSHDLLSPEDRQLFRRLAVFAGGWTLEDAEAVCADGGLDVLDGLESLVAKSLVRQDPAAEAPRFLLLETIREFAAEQLETSGEREMLQRRHAERYAELAEETEPTLRGPQPEPAVARLDAEHGNVRVALAWAALAAEAGDPDAGRLAFRLATGFWRYWVARAHSTEGIAALERTLALPGAVEIEDLLRSRAMLGAGALLFFKGRFAEARARLDESLTLARRAGDEGTVAWALLYLGWMGTDAQHPAARGPLLEALALGQARNDIQILARALNILSYDASWNGDVAEGRARAEEVLALCQRAGYRWGIAHSLLDLGLAHWAAEDFVGGHRLFLQSASVYRGVGDRYFVAMDLGGAAYCAGMAGDLAECARLMGEAVPMYLELGAQWSAAMVLLLHAGVVARFGRAEDALRLFGAQGAAFAAMGVQPPWLFTHQAERELGPAVALLDPAARDRARAEGERMELREALFYATSLLGELARLGVAIS